MITLDAQLLEPGEKVELFELDYTKLGGDVLRFHGYQQLGSIFWQGLEYTPWAIAADGFGSAADARQPTPTLNVGNIGKDASGNDVAGIISSLCAFFDDLLGAKLIRHTTLGKYLDVQNFPDGINPNADPTQEFPPDVWYIEQKMSETNESVAFSLSSVLDLNGVMLPRRQVIANSCSWINTGGYRGPYCNYTGAAMFDINDRPVTDSALDVCSGKLSSCKKRFGEYEVINFGNFPAASLISR